MSLSLLRWNTANISFIIVCIQSPPRLPMMQAQKSLTRCWLSCSGWGSEGVSLIFGYKGSRFIPKGQWCTKVNILRLAVEYLNATVNRNTRSTGTEIGSDRSSEARQDPRVDRYGSGFGPTRCSASGFWTVPESNRTRTAGGLPGPFANTRWHRSMPRGDIWYGQRQCEPFVKCSLPHSQKWVHWS